MVIFRNFRRFLAAIEDLADRLQEVGSALNLACHLQEGLGPATDRLANLELSRAKFEAEMNGLVLKAEGKFKAANNAEARERQLRKSRERLNLEEGDPDSQGLETPGSPVLGDDVEVSERERLHALRLGVAPVDGKALALNHKWRS